MVPADKAANNVIVVCKKYYLEVVLSELNTTSMYEHDDRDCEYVVTEHLRYMTNNNISVEPIYALTFTIILLAAKVTKTTVWHDIYCCIQ